jgi:hypothetical protein
MALRSLFFSVRPGAIPPVFGILDASQRLRCPLNLSSDKRIASRLEVPSTRKQKLRNLRGKRPSGCRPSSTNSPSARNDAT